MDDTDLDREDFGDADTRFHVALARGGGNRLFADMTQAIRESLRAPLLDGYRAHEDWSGLRETLQHQHRELLAAVAAGDAERASQLAAEHIHTSYQVLPADSGGSRRQGNRTAAGGV